MSANPSRKETERTKLIQEKCQTLLTQMLRDEDNKYCVDCDAKGPRWASWNLGVFLCIRCAGIHRNLGVHISRVKSVNLDTWTPEQVISLQQMGNSRARAVYEAQLPDGFRRPQTDNALESFIRAKYEHKKYLAREWVPPMPPKVDWAKEIDEELEKQKRKKKAAQAGSALGIGIISGSSSDKKSSGSTIGSNVSRSAPLPAPLPKPKPGQSGSSPKTQRLNKSSNTNIEQQTCNDLLGLSSPTKPVQGNVVGSCPTQDESFSGFLSAPMNNTPVAICDSKSLEQHASPQNSTSTTNNSLAKEEEDFFNQGSLGSAGGDKDKSGKLTKDSILALYGAAPSNPLSTANPHNQQMNFGQQAGPQLFSQNNFGTTGHNMNFTGMTPGFMGAAVGVPQQQQQQHPQFMTPPNSASMYNAPVMTAPTAFSTPGMGGMQMGNAVSANFGAQFPGMTQSMSHASYTSQMPSGMIQPQSMMMGGGIMATGQAAPVNTVNLMQTNQSLLSGMQIGLGGMQQQQTIPQMSSAGVGMHSMGGLITGVPSMGGLSAISAFQSPMAGGPATANSTANLNQQFGNLNIGNVWQ